ncbi:hypothetical protein TTHERM_000316518 (macronuclear) [Tetrahymena thermophila SB210]|uniref:Uncharacterized protein n=1 Tax=Tetrahymena thermophila (strain SB210) TaxID=312017 RepID=W7X6R7_TETTS|nr:hypothetical protein TTHERM_000316518 [Tetrahymena thermophila SB210]EWS73072.1 hypothetical protein TTHERM_000316518 [Tetrahymena thermophila SB210]|eukprot:XP_012654381.1 hypothetical protein TTHERM_000316518 [Tetrahymena thermophila SB210]
MQAKLLIFFISLKTTKIFIQYYYKIKSFSIYICNYQGSNFYCERENIRSNYLVIKKFNKFGQKKHNIEKLKYSKLQLKKKAKHKQISTLDEAVLMDFISNYIIIDRTGRAASNLEKKSDDQSNMSKEFMRQNLFQNNNSNNYRLGKSPRPVANTQFYSQKKQSNIVEDQLSKAWQLIDTVDRHLSNSNRDEKFFLEINQDRNEMISQLSLINRRRLQFKIQQQLYLQE